MYVLKYTSIYIHRTGERKDVKEKGFDMERSLAS